MKKQGKTTVAAKADKRRLVKGMGSMLPAGIMLAGMFGGVFAVQADVLNLAAAQDASVKYGYGGRVDDKGVVVNASGNRWKFYIQFDLPAGTAGNITDASLDLVVSKSVNRSLDVVLLTNETIDAWSESTIKFDNAPGSVNADVSQNYSADSYNLADTALLVDNESVSEAVDATHTFDLSSSIALLNADSDGKLTLVLSGTGISSSYPEFYSSESANGPILNLTIPEPATLGLVGISGLALMVIRRKLSM